jgi:hypothetical protein
MAKKIALMFVAGALVAWALSASSAGGQTVTQSTSTGGITIQKTTTTLPPQTVTQQQVASVSVEPIAAEQSQDDANKDGSDVPWWVWAALILLFAGIALAIFWGRDRESLPPSPSV